MSNVLFLCVVAISAGALAALMRAVWLWVLVKRAEWTVEPNPCGTCRHFAMDLPVKFANEAKTSTWGRCLKKQISTTDTMHVVLVGFQRRCWDGDDHA